MLDSDVSGLTDNESDEGKPPSSLPTTATSSPPTQTAGRDGPPTHHGDSGE
jgi:hypothetical protein